MEKNLLNLQFYSRDLDQSLTIKAFFIKLLTTLWEEKEGFSGKRPLGNSNWEFDLAIGLIKNNILPGKLDEYGYIEELDMEIFDKFVLEEIIEKL